MDRIVLTGVHANGTHGVLEFEHERAQPFVVDATLYMDLTAAGASDDLNDTVDYGRAAKEIVAVIEGEHADLIEHLAQRIADRLLTDGRLDAFVAERYASWKTGVGADVVAGKATMEQLEAYALQLGDVTTNRSGRQEYLENIVNAVMFG